MDEPLRCSYCRTVIGEHEAMIVLGDPDGAQEETISSASASSQSAGERYHRHCYRQVFSQLRPGEQ